MSTPDAADVDRAAMYERQPNGSWKLTHDIWNSDQSVPS